MQKKAKKRGKKAEVICLRAFRLKKAQEEKDRMTALLAILSGLRKVS